MTTDTAAELLKGLDHQDVQIMLSEINEDPGAEGRLRWTLISELAKALDEADELEEELERSPADTPDPAATGAPDPFASWTEAEVAIIQGHQWRHSARAQRLWEASGLICLRSAERMILKDCAGQLLNLRVDTRSSLSTGHVTGEEETGSSALVTLLLAWELAGDGEMDVARKIALISERIMEDQKKDDGEHDYWECPSAEEGDRHTKELWAHYSAQERQQIHALMGLVMSERADQGRIKTPWILQVQQSWSTAYNRAPRSAEEWTAQEAAGAKIDSADVCGALWSEEWLSLQIGKRAVADVLTNDPFLACAALAPRHGASCAAAFRQWAAALAKKARSEDGELLGEVMITLQRLYPDWLEAGLTPLGQTGTEPAAPQPAAQESP